MPPTLPIDASWPAGEPRYIMDEASEKSRLDAPSAEAVVAEFMVSLRAVTPNLRVVTALVAINVAVFVGMVATGVAAFAPDAARVMAWGANYGPKTLRGEPWRLLASMFLHFGAIHLLMNMVALVSAGRLVERIFGHARFVAIYLVAGLCGSVASLAVHPRVVSAGASGAVFGIYGALGGFLLRERSAIPGPVLSKLRGVALGFIGYNVLYGFTHPNIDAAAHIGGALAGAVAGTYLARPLMPGRKDPLGRVAIVAAACATVLGFAYASLPPLGRVRLSNRQLPGFSIALPDGEIVEEKGEYQVGKLMLKTDIGGRSAVAVAWQTGTTSRTEREVMANATSSMVGATRPARIVTSRGPGGVSVHTAEMDSEERMTRMSMLACGKREIILVTTGPSGIDVLHRRVLKTVACHPDARLEETDFGVVPVNINLPGWFAIDRTGAQLLLSDGRSLFLLRSMAHSTRKLGVVLAATFNAMGEEIAITASGPEAATLTGTFRGSHVEGWARSLRCPTSGVLLVLFAPDLETADRIGALTSSARCTKTGEQPSSWPDAAKPANP